MLECRNLSAALLSAAAILGTASATAQDAQRTPPPRTAAEAPAQPAAEIREADRPLTTHSGGTVERAGHAVDEVVDKTGKVVRKVVDKTKEGVKTVVGKTGQTVRKAGEKIEEIAAPNKP